MGKPTTQNNNFKNHFSHPHPLQLVPAAASSPPCSGCKLAGGNGRVYSCRPCNFFLHETCSKMKEVITHPSHPSHTLTLLVAPVYDGGYFNCDACGIIGTGFSYQCSRCDYDIHALCAYKPLSVVHKSHPNHSLKLAFHSPYGANKGFSCDVCTKLGKNQWLYRCVPCEFDAHVGCINVASAPQPHHLQHSGSAPTPNAHHANQGNSRPRPRPNGPIGNSGRPISNVSRPNGPNNNPGRPNGPNNNPGRRVGNLNRQMAQNAGAYGPGRQNNNLGYNGQVGPNELTDQVGQSFGQGSMDGSGYDGSAGNKESDVGEVDVEIENEDGEAYDEGDDVNFNGNGLEIVAYGNDSGTARSESSFGDSSDARSQCTDLPGGDLYPQGPVRVKQGSGRGPRGRRGNASPNGSNCSTPRSSRSGPRGGLQGCRSPVQNPRAPPTRRGQNLRNRNNALGAGASVGFNTAPDLGAFNGPPQGFNNGPSGGPSNEYDNGGNYDNNYNNQVDGADMYGTCEDNGPPQGFNNGPSGGPSNEYDNGGNDDNNYNNQGDGADMYGTCEDSYDENYGEDYAGGDGDCDFEAGGEFVDDGFGEGYDETYGENDFESYSDFTGGSESMYGDESYGTMDDSQYSGLNGEPDNQFLPTVGLVGGPGINNPNQYGQTGRPRNMGRSGRGGARNMNVYGNMNQGANNIQPRTMGRGRAAQYRPNGRVNRGPNGPNGNTAMTQMVQGLCKGVAMNMLLGVGGDILGGGGDGGDLGLGDLSGGDSSALGGLFGGDSESMV